MEENTVQSQHWFANFHRKSHRKQRFVSGFVAFKCDLCLYTDYVECTDRCDDGFLQWLHCETSTKIRKISLDNRTVKSQEEEANIVNFLKRSEGIHCFA